MFSIIISLLITSISHPLFISMTEVEYNSSTQNLDISIRVFTDDFESALRKNDSTNIDLTHPKDKKNINENIKSYMLRNLSTSADGKAIEMQYVGYEIIEENTWVYFEAPVEKIPKDLSISNSIFYDFSTKQINLMHIKIGQEERTEKNSYPEKLFRFQF